MVQLLVDVWHSVVVRGTPIATGFPNRIYNSVPTRAAVAALVDGGLELSVSWKGGSAEPVIIGLLKTRWSRRVKFLCWPRETSLRGQLLKRWSFDAAHVDGIYGLHLLR